MTTAIRDITSDDIRLFGDIVARLERMGPEADVRAAVLEDVVRLVRGDFAGSYIWNSDKSRFEQALRVNMSADNLQRYDDWFQFRDPMTHALRARRKATLVEAVIPQRDLERTEFFNDFLARDGLHHGVNIFIFDGDRDLGDLRIWRGRGRPKFGARELGLLDALEPFLQRALRRCDLAGRGLTAREREVALLVTRGCTDHDIARILGIGFATVRTHLTRAMEKRGCANRAELASSVSRYDS
jgi:DNA-binding CsgD family transcriptional regulator